MKLQSIQADADGGCFISKRFRRVCEVALKFVFSKSNFYYLYEGLFQEGRQINRVVIA